MLAGARLGAQFEVRETAAEAGAGRVARIVLVPRRGEEAVAYRAALELLAQAPELRPAREDALRALQRANGDRPRPTALRPVALGRKTSLDALIDGVLAECLRCVAHDEAAARAPAEVEGVHQMRVAVRRLRSALRMFRDELSRERADGLRAALAPLADALGDVRDLDVLLERIARREAAGALRLADLREAATSERRVAFAAMEELFDSTERAQLDLELGLLVFGRDWREPARGERAAASAKAAARLFVARADRRALRTGKGFTALTLEQRHRLRLRVKSARYAAELLAPLLPTKRTRRYVRSARALQDALGAERDAVRMRALAERLVPESAQAAVESLQGERAESAEVLSPECERAWRRFRSAPRPLD